MEIKDFEDNKILAKRKVFYVAIYDNNGHVAAFVSSPLSFAASRANAALFETKEEAEVLKVQAEKRGIVPALVFNYSCMQVGSAIQYQVNVWKF